VCYVLILVDLKHFTKFILTKNTYSSDFYFAIVFFAMRPKLWNDTVNMVITIQGGPKKTAQS